MLKYYDYITEFISEKFDVSLKKVTGAFRFEAEVADLRH